MRTSLKIAVLSVFIITSPVLTAAGAFAMETAAAAKFIDKLNHATFNMLQSKRLTQSQKRSKVRTLLSDNFNLDLIGKFVLGSSWRKASPGQRKEYLSLFRKYILTTYSRQFIDYSGRKIEIIDAKPIGKRDILVITNITRSSGPPIKAGWRVRSDQGGHQILDVVVAGVSMVLTQRSEFRSVVRRRGFGGLLATLRTQIAANVTNN